MMMMYTAACLPCCTIQVVDETKLWAKVPRQDCDAFMAARRLAGVQRSGGGTGGTSAADGAAAGARPTTTAGGGGGSYGGGDDASYAAGVSREGMAGWHRLFGPGLSPSGTLPEDEAPDPDDRDDYTR